MYDHVSPLTFVHTTRRSYRLSDPVNNSDWRSNVAKPIINHPRIPNPSVYHWLCQIHWDSPSNLHSARRRLWRLWRLVSRRRHLTSSGQLGLAVIYGANSHFLLGKIWGIIYNYIRMSFHLCMSVHTDIYVKSFQNPFESVLHLAMKGKRYAFLWAGGRHPRSSRDICWFPSGDCCNIPVGAAYKIIQIL